MRFNAGFFLSLSIVLLFSACADPPPSLKIVEPMPSQTVKLAADADLSVDVRFRVSNFVMRQPDTCPVGDTACGHVHLKINADACNEPGKMWNNEGYLSPLKARFVRCNEPTGNHQIKVSLHDDQHDPVMDDMGKEIAEAVAITTMR